MLLEIDPINYTIAIVGYLIVFSALVLLYLVFSSIPKILKIRIRKNLKRQGKKMNPDSGKFVIGVENAAIATALYLYFNELHDDEDTVITIKKVMKVYSPWNSKLHGMNTLSR